MGENRLRHASRHVVLDILVDFIRLKVDLHGKRDEYFYLPVYAGRNAPTDRGCPN